MMTSSWYVFCIKASLESWGIAHVFAFVDQVGKIFLTDGIDSIGMAMELDKPSDLSGFAAQNAGIKILLKKVIAKAVLRYDLALCSRLVCSCVHTFQADTNFS